MELTWTCHICKRERPDNKISVFSKPLIVDGQELGKQNIRHCNDNLGCCQKAREFSFIK